MKKGLFPLFFKFFQPNKKSFEISRTKRDIPISLIRPISLIGLISPMKIRGECLVDHTGIVLFLHGTPGNPDIGAVQQDSLFAGRIGSGCGHAEFTG